MGEASAWLLSLGDEALAAVGELEMVHVVDSPELFEVPLSPPHCNRVLVWQERLLPVMDLARWLWGQVGERPRYAGITAWWDAQDGSPRYGALLLAGLPIRIRVSDEDACALPHEPCGWASLALSCFQHRGGSVPVLDLPHIFSGSLVR
jgi:hypothetical protein